MLEGWLIGCWRDCQDHVRHAPQVKTAQQLADGDLDGVTDALTDAGVENAADAAGFELESLKTPLTP